MKRIISYIIVVALLLLVPVKRTDVGKLIPVEVVFLYQDQEMIVLETDTGNLGRGETVEAALWDMHETAQGQIYLDTAEYLLIEEGAEEHIGEIGNYLKESVRVCKANVGIDLKQAAAYLEIHKPKAELKAAKTAEITEKLEQYGEQLKIS